MEEKPGYISDLPAGRHQGVARGLPGGGGRQVDPQQVGDSLPSLAVSRLWSQKGQTGSLPALEITVSGQLDSQSIRHSELEIC